MRKLLLIIGLSLASRAAYGQCSAFAFNPFTGKLDCVGVNSISPGTGDVVGPASSTANHIPQYSNTTGKLLKDGLALVTTVGSPGADTAVPTEAAVRTAIAAAGGVAFTGTQTADALVTRAGSANQIKNPIATSTLDASGNFSTAGGYTAGAGGAAAGFLDLGQGTAPASPASGHFQLTVSTISAPYVWTVPAADAAGAVASNGAGALSVIGFSGTGNIARVGSPTFTGSVAAAVLTLSGALSGTSASFSGALTTNLTGSGTKCVHADNSGVLGLAAADCGTGGGGSGDVVGPSSAVDDHLAAFNTTTGKLIRDSSVLVNHSTGDITTAGGISTGSGGGVSGFATLGAGTTPPSPASGEFQLRAPSLISTPYFWTVPPADASGCISSNGSGALSIVACGSGGSSALSAITAATGGNSIANGDNAQVWNWAMTTAARIGYKIGETSAATSTGTSYLLQAITAAGSTATALNVTNSLTGSQTLAAVSITPTWNTTGVVDAALLINATNTASGAASKLIDAQVGGASQFSLDVAGVLNAAGSLTVGTAPAYTAGSGGSLGATEGTASTGAASVDLLYAKSSTHRWMMNNNNGGELAVVGESGALTSGHCPQFDANGNLVDSGSTNCGGGGGGTVTSSGSPLIHQVAIFTTATDIKGIAVGATDKPLVGVTGADAAFSKLTLTNPATGSTFTLADGKTLTISNTLTLAGTDSTTMTFPSTSATVARTDAANTFSGHQTIEGVTSTGATGTGNLVFATTPTLTTPRVTTVNDANGNPFIASTATASAVDGITVTNAASANPATVKISATSTVDSNINLELDVKGSGVLQTNATTLTIGVGSGQAAVLDLSATTATFSGLASVLTTNGQITFCADCTVTSGANNTCAGSGTGAVAMRVNGVNKCVI